MQRSWPDEAATLWLAPLVATIPLIPIMSIRSSPFFIGRLMDDPTHPFNWPHTGPLISAAGVVFDAGILGILLVLFLVAPIYSGLRKYGKNSALNIMILCGGAGLLASQIARMVSRGFHQADLRAFASSGIVPILGCLCGLAAGAFIAAFANRRMARVPICCIPAAALGICLVVIMWSSELWRGR
jgi:hypothetical protein